MAEEVLIRAEGVSKKFCRSLKKSMKYGVSDIISDLNPFSRKSKESPQIENSGSEDPELKAAQVAAMNKLLRPDEFWASNNISFEVKRGECIGLIGRNGAGKTTLLKMLNGLVKPDRGRIEMRGRVGALIALGAGFNPILSGRENIYVNGSVLGLTKKEIDAKIEGIIDFSEIREFIDAPVQSYSSGMQVRLGFSVTTALEPDVLILDEVLAVGDAAFRARCYKRIGEILKKTAVIFVSHNMEQIGALCTKGLVLSRGKPVFMGPIEPAIEKYYNTLDAPSLAAEQSTESFSKVFHPVTKAEVKLLSEPSLAFGDKLELSLDVESIEKRPIHFRLQVFNRTWQSACESTWFETYSLPVGPSSWKLTVPQLDLNAGSYFVSLLMYGEKFPETLVWSRGQLSFEVRGTRVSSTHYRLPLQVSPAG